MNTPEQAVHIQNAPQAVSVAPGVFTVIANAYKVVVHRMDVLVVVFALVVLSNLLPVILGIAIGDSESIVVRLSSFVASSVNAINVIVLLYLFTTADASKGYIDGLRWLGKNFLSYIWIGIIVGALKMGGFFLLLIPGIILSVYASLSIPVLVAEGTRGMDAVLRSRELVRGRFWYTATVLSIFSLIVLLIFIVTVAVIAFTNTTLGLPEVSVPASLLSVALVSVLQVVAITLGAAAVAQLYRVYTQLTPVLTGGKSARVKYIIIAWVGVAFIPLMLISAIGLASLNGAQSLAKDAMVQATISSFRVEAELYADGNSFGEVSYAGVCDALESKYQSLSDTGVSAVCNDSSDAYAIEADLSTGEYYCIDSAWYGGARDVSIVTGTSCQ